MATLTISIYQQEEGRSSVHHSKVTEPKSVGVSSGNLLREGMAGTTKGDRYARRQFLEDNRSHLLSDEELLRCLLDLACPKGSNSGASENLVRRFGSFGKTLSSSATDLGGVLGLNEHAMAAIKIIYAASLRFLRYQAFDQQRRLRRQYFFAYLNAAMSREAIEQTRVFYFDDKLRLLAEKILWTGTTNHTPVYVRELAYKGLCMKASKLILVHNHPSGSRDPSLADASMTSQVSLALKGVGLELWDSIIVGNGEFFSFKGEGRLLATVKKGVDPMEGYDYGDGCEYDYQPEPAVLSEVFFEEISGLYDFD